MHRSLLAVGAAAAWLSSALSTFPAAAQTSQQKIVPPTAVYWVSAETRAGIAGLPGAGASGALGGLLGSGA
ncbi:MAG: hypothetical protein H7125_13790, partial [Proteobacteria bacterium]|nr:hypothetical protein [Burkholderiales bacterium]